MNWQRLLVAAVLCFASAWCIGYSPAKPVCLPEGFSDQLKLGMTEKEIESVLGMPAGDYCSDEWLCHLSAGGLNCWEQEGEYSRSWYTDKIGLDVRFDKHGRAFSFRQSMGFDLGPRFRWLAKVFPWIDWEKVF